MNINLDEKKLLEIQSDINQSFSKLGYENVGAVEGSYTKLGDLRFFIRNKGSDCWQGELHDEYVNKLEQCIIDFRQDVCNYMSFVNKTLNQILENYAAADKEVTESVSGL